MKPHSNGGKLMFLIDTIMILVRLVKPTQMLEVGALCGGSTRWVLAAMEANGAGTLTSFDLSRQADSLVTQHRDRWKFRQADVITHLAKDPNAFAEFANRNV